MKRRMTLARGPHRLNWTPRTRGAYRVQVLATGLSGPKRAVRRTVSVRPLRKKIRPKPQMARRRPAARPRAKLG
jgi:hypothetical protein